MAQKKIIAVTGATGAQGGGLARAILADKSGEFAVRAMTRDVNSAKAKELASRGAEVVHANLDDPASLTKAFEGAYGAFCVTFFWEHMDPARETRNALALAEAARQAGVQHVIWSTLEDSRKWIPLSDNRMPTLQGRYKVPHFDAKADADHAFKNLPSTLLLTSFYWDNLIFFGMAPKRGEDGVLGFVLPMADQKLPSIAAGDIGKCALGIFRRGKELIGKTVGIAGEHLSGSEMAASLSRALGEEVRYNYIPPEVFRTFGFPGADDLANMFQFNRDFAHDFAASRSLEFSRSVNPQLQTFDQWLNENRSRLQIEPRKATA